MGIQVIKQPDDKFALFSSNTDTIVMADATAEDVLEHFVHSALADTYRRVTYIIECVASGCPELVYHQFARSWDEVLETDREHDGDYTRGEFVDGPAADEEGPLITVDITDAESVFSSLGRLSPRVRGMMSSALARHANHPAPD